MSSGTSKRVAAVVCVLALLVAPVAGAGFGGLAQEQVDPDTVVLQADLQADGDAQWAVIYRTRLDDDNTTAAFESLQADIRNNSTAYTADFGDRMNRTVRTAENATGREMTLRNLTITAERVALPQSYGVVTYRFEWTNFAAVDGERLRAGDALAGLFLDAESTLRMGWPEGYERTSVAPDPDRNDSRQVAWDGRRDFGPEEPSLVVSKSTGSQQPSGDGDAWLLVVATVLAAGGVVALLWANRRYRFTGGPATTADGDAVTDDGDTGTPAVPTAADERSGDDASDSADETGADDRTETPPPELLSNEEQVLQLLDNSGGRIKQQRIAEQLDWTAAKTSQVISGLREDDDVETFRIGRENVVTLPEVDIADDIGPDGDGTEEDGE